MLRAAGRETKAAGMESGYPAISRVQDQEAWCIGTMQGKVGLG